jgi:CheY-like chemotaxis protein
MIRKGKYMEMDELNYYYNKLKFGEDNFHNLMKYRIKKILIISTFYDAYIFEYDAKLSNQIVGEYHSLNLTTVPRLISVPTGEEALKKLKEGSFDLVISTIRIGEMSPFDLSDKIHESYPELTILLLLTVKTDINLIDNNRDRMKNIEEVFLWNGNPRLFLAMIKYVEDKRNAPYDTGKGYVNVILLVEDSITFSSIYLPLLYAEIMEQTQRLISEEQNDNNKYLRMRTRPKVIMVRSFEDAVEAVGTYKESLLGIISDIEYLHKGEIDTDAGFEFLSYLKENKIDVPVLLQSSDISKRPRAESMNVKFLHKKSSTLLLDISQFIFRKLGFGSLIFRNSNGEEIGRARHLADFEKLLPSIPPEILVYHSQNDSFSAWLIAHGDIEIAKKVRPVQVSDFSSLEEHKDFLLQTFKRVRRKRNKGKIVDFNKDILGEGDIIIRVGSGSLGGKGRGLAFFNALLNIMDLDSKFKNTAIRIPKSVVLGTGVFDLFIESNNLVDIHINLSDDQIKQKFLEGSLPEYVRENLVQFLEYCHCPIAVRSSGLLEDSQSQPFAGVYATYMLANNNEIFKERLTMLTDAIKLVFASVFLEDAVSYIETLNYGMEEEKMGVIIQEIVGKHHEDYFYPHFSGVAQSYNYYPISHMQHSEGVANIAVGLGQSVVGGGKDHMFCPSHPQIEYKTIDDKIRTSQTDFFALNMTPVNTDLTKGEEETLIRLPVRKAEKHKTLTHAASVWDSANERIIEDLSIPGPRVISFANILKYNYFPLSDILMEILDISQKAMGIPVEIEFAVDLNKSTETLPTFYLLQVRPLSHNEEEVYIDPENLNMEKSILYSTEALGNGFIKDISDIVFLDPLIFDKTHTMEMKEEIKEINSILKKEDRDYILIGPGRWGTRDRFLGIPVNWGEINRAGIIIETGLIDFDIEPSQGSHFFHNLVAMNIGYLNIPYHHKGNSFIDWDFLRSLKPVNSRKFFTHVSRDIPFTILMDGKEGNAVILK